MTSDRQDRSLASLWSKRATIAEINAEIFQLAQKRQQIEGEFLRELAVLIGRPGAALLDSHHACPGSLIGNCVFEIKPTDSNVHCLFCGGGINR